MNMPPPICTNKALACVAKGARLKPISPYRKGEHIYTYLLYTDKGSVYRVAQSVYDKLGIKK